MVHGNHAAESTLHLTYTTAEWSWFAFFVVCDCESTINKRLNVPNELRKEKTTAPWKLTRLPPHSPYIFFFLFIRRTQHSGYGTLEKPKMQTTQKHIHRTLSKENTKTPEILSKTHHTPTHTPPSPPLPWAPPFSKVTSLFFRKLNKLGSMALVNLNRLVGITTVSTSNVTSKRGAIQPIYVHMRGEASW